MCLYSKEELTRRARHEDALTIASVRGHSNNQKVAAPAERIGNEVCVCLKTDDRFQFNDLPLQFQQQWAVGPNAVAVFIEGSGESNTKDLFDFQNGSLVPMEDMPLAASFVPLELSGVEKPALPMVEDATPTQSEAELVPVGGNESTRGRSRILVGVGAVAFVAASFTGFVSW
jgi:hypothetical protein